MDRVMGMLVDKNGIHIDDANDNKVFTSFYAPTKELPIHTYNINTSNIFGKYCDVEQWCWKYSSPFDAFDAAINIYDFVKTTYLVSELFLSGRVSLKVFDGIVTFTKVGTIGNFSIKLKGYKDRLPIMELVEKQ